MTLVENLAVAGDPTNEELGLSCLTEAENEILRHFGQCLEVITVPFSHEGKPAIGVQSETHNEGTKGVILDPISGDLDEVGLYLQEIGKIPLLTTEEEVILAKEIEKGTKAQVKLAENNFTNNERIGLEEAVATREAARDHFIKANLRLVVAMAKKYLSRGAPFLELIQEGNLGLVKAVEKFDHTKGYRFSTYATWCIRAAIEKVIADSDERTVSLQMLIGNDGCDDELGDVLEDESALKPEDEVTDLILKRLIQEAFQALPIKERQVLELYFGLADARTYTLKEIGAKLGISGEQAREIKTQALLYLKRSTGDESMPDPEVKVFYSILIKLLPRAFQLLSLRERQVLQLRYGFGLADARTYTLKEIGAKLGVTRERVYGIETKAFFFLRNTLIDLVGNGSMLTSNIELADSMLMELLPKILYVLPIREKQIFKLLRVSTDTKTHTLEEIGKKNGLNGEQMWEIKDQVFLRLRTNLQASLNNLIENKITLDVMDRLADLILIRLIQEAFQALPIEERQVLELYFGLADARTYTLEEIASQLRISCRQQAYKIKVRAFFHLSANLRNFVKEKRMLVLNRQLDNECLRNFLNFYGKHFFEIYHLGKNYL